MQGSIYRPRYKDRRGTKRESNVSWLRVSVNGTLIRESTGTDDEDEARAVLERRYKELQSVTLASLERLFLDDYAFNGYRTERRARELIGHVVSYFGPERSDLTGQDIASYIRSGLEAGVTRATVNRETAALKRAFKLATQRGLAVSGPRIPKLRENNARQGFIEREQLERIVSFLSPYLRPPVSVAFVTGWRFRSELQSMRWSQVDFERGWIRLEPRTTKNRDGREFPLIPELRSILEEQRQDRSDFVFHHRDGRRIREPKNAWNDATRKAGSPGLRIHDLRRSAARNMVRAGVSPLVAMKLCGWRSLAMLQGYAIVESTLLAEAGEKLSYFGSHGTSSIRSE